MWPVIVSVAPVLVMLLAVSVAYLSVVNSASVLSVVISVLQEVSEYAL